MKKVWVFLVDVLGSIARARAAMEMTRQGRHDLAKQIMLKD